MCLARINYKLTLVWLLLSLSILTLSYEDVRGMLSHDSAFYLRLAENIINGHGYFEGDILGGTEGAYFTAWPVGYPTIIAGIAYIVSVDVFLASKISNILLLGLAFYFLHKLFTETAYLYGSVFLTAPLLHFTAMTLAEGPFMAGMIILTISLYYYYTSEKTIWLISTLISSIFLFLLRYVGLFSLLPIAGLAIYYLWLKKSDAFVKLLGVGSLSLVFCGLYLYKINALTGYLTGQPRVFSDTRPELFAALIVGQAKELNLISYDVGYSGSLVRTVYVLTLIISLLVISYMILGRVDYRKAHTQNTSNVLFIFFFLTGVCYLISIVGSVVMRKVPSAELLSGRLLVPATPLFVIGLLSYLQFNRGQGSRLTKYWLPIPVSSFLLNVVLFPFYSTFVVGQKTYVDHVAMIQEKYKVIHRGNVLIGNNDYARFLRPDIHYIRLYQVNLLDEIIRKQCSRGVREIYIDIGADLHILSYDYTLVENFERYGSTNALLAKIKACDK